MNRKESENFFDYLRYYAAFCVMFLHFTGIVGHYIPEEAKLPVNVLRGISTFFQPTVILLTMSGFLSSASFDRLGQKVLPFLKKRMKRIYFDMWLSMAVYVAVLYFVVGKLFDSSMIKWAITQGIGIANTPSCLKEFATGSINGTMWFFTVIIQLYIVLVVVKKLVGESRKLSIWILIVAVAGVMNIVSGLLTHGAPDIVLKLVERTFIPYAFWFFVGVMFQTCGLYKTERIRVLFFILLASQVILNILPESGLGYYTDFFRGTVTCLITPVAAFSLPAKRVKLDITYGLYLYHWLFLNLIIHYRLYEKLSLPVNILIFVACTLASAYVFRVNITKTKVAVTQK